MIVLAVGLAVLGVAVLLGLSKLLKPQGERVEIAKTQKFWSLGNFGYFIAVALAGCIWIFVLLTRFGVGAG
jgi:hypothetical protein